MFLHRKEEYNANVCLNDLMASLESGMHGQHIQTSFQKVLLEVRLVLLRPLWKGQ